MTRRIPRRGNSIGRMSNTALFQKGVDAWWLDTDEPETEGQQDNILVDHKIGDWVGSAVCQCLSAVSYGRSVGGPAGGIGQEARIYFVALGVCGSAALWRDGVVGRCAERLGDVSAADSCGTELLRSPGMPYWTTDIGGFISGGNLNDPKFRELFVRWFQFGAFSPIFRVHGTRNPDENELWSYGPEAQKILVDYDTLRYRLMPYIYSEAWQVTSNHGTLMRPLVMDWRNDVEAQNTGDEYMFGPAILVSPVTTQGATTRHGLFTQGDLVRLLDGREGGGRKAD